MRVVHLITQLDPAMGGPPKIAACIAAAQSAISDEIYLMHADASDRQGAIDEMLGQIPGSDRVKYIRLEPQGAGTWLFGTPPAPFAQHIADADFMHLHDLWSPMMVRAGREARQTGTPYTMLINGMLDPWSLAQSKFKKKLAMMLFHRKLLNGAAYLHLGNRDEQQLIEPLGLTVGHRLIPNGVFEQEITGLPAHGGFYEAYPALNGKPFALFMSRLHYKKGTDYLAEAFALFARTNDEVHLVVAGPDGGMLEDLNQRVAKHKLEDRVHIVGPIYGQTKQMALRDAACFILPSHQEGFSVAITEALGCGLPVIATHGCHYPEVAEADAGYLTDVDAEQVADSLTKMFADDARREQMGRNGQELALSRFTWPRVAQQCLDAYREQIDRRAATSAA